MKILVAGSGGFLGLPLCSALQRRGHKVVGCDRFFFGVRPNDIEYFPADTRTLTSDSLIGFDAVVDLAGLSNDASCEIDETYTKSINEDGGKNLFGCAQKAGVRRYIYASSASVYGAGRKNNLTETDQTNPLTAYAKSKLAVEDFILTRRLHSEPVILRLSTLFGVSRRMRFDLAINAMSRSAWCEHLITVNGDGHQIRPFLHVLDAADAIVWALEATTMAVSGQIFNVGFDENQMSIREAAVRVQECHGAAIIRDMPGNMDARSYHLCFDKYNAVRGGIPIRLIEDGVDEIIEALNSGTIDRSDPTAMTMPYYRSLLEWDKRLEKIKLDGRLM